MAGVGRAPKPKGQRVNRHEPQRGEWVDLVPLVKPVLPAAHAKWSPRVKLLWRAWRADPVSSQWGPADLAAVWDLACIFDALQPNEQRLRMDSFGLTPKGKRDLRWRTPQEVATIQAQAPAGSVPRLRVVDTEVS